MKHKGREYEAYVEWAMEALGITQDEATLYADDAFGIYDAEP